VSPLAVEPPWINEYVPNAARVINTTKFEGTETAQGPKNSVSSSVLADPSVVFVDDLEVSTLLFLSLDTAQTLVNKF
jgi:hypothetical protein